MQGILVVDKPEGFTSFDVVAKLRGICGTRRIGHGGTLDPMATGVLPVFVGGAAKAVDMQERADKMYTATMLLGRRTDTGDVTGETLEQAAVPADIGLDAVAAMKLGRNLDAKQYLLSLKQNYQADDDIAGMIESRLEKLKTEN